MSVVLAGGTVEPTGESTAKALLLLPTAMIMEPTILPRAPGSEKFRQTPGSLDSVIGSHSTKASALLSIRHRILIGRSMPSTTHG